MKIILKHVSYSFLAIGVLAALAGALFSISGILMLLVSVFDHNVIQLVTYCAVGYFGAVALLLFIYGCVCLYRLIEKKVTKA